ncbi:YusW family protein [Bacillus sp. FJAT-27251]|uniref:YusW family protein n=1 Tax=Bacillus sp. FJAT-27251 TaxID=1684142 RepID=UPI0006A7F213|nr:YusW family protein [Bacillus sp. FJAT-27251]
MKKLPTIVSTLFLAGTLAACGANNDANDTPAPPQDNNNATQQENNNNNQQGNNNTSQQENANQNSETTFSFTNFDLDVDYGNQESYEVDYELEKEETETKLEDDRNNIQLEGQEAFDQLRPQLEKLTFDQNTSDDEVVSEVLKAFSLGDDYQEFELEVKFNDGTEKEYKHKK